MARPVRQEKVPLQVVIVQRPDTDPTGERWAALEDLILGTEYKMAKELPP